MSNSPVHIMRWAPADYENDPFVMLMKKRGAYRVLAFYSSFLFRSHMAGGSLPADIDLLAAALSLDNRTTTIGLSTCKQHAKIQQAGDRVFHKRVVDGIAKELSYRENQSRVGSLGGRPKKATLSTPESPPSPSPAPLPAPSPTTDKRPSDLRSGVAEVFSHWQAVMEHPDSKLTDERRRKVEGRLREGSTVDQIKAAIDGCRASAFHMGQNDAGKRHDDLTLICRTGAKLDWFRQRAVTNGNGAGNGTRHGPRPTAAEVTGNAVREILAEEAAKREATKLLGGAK